MAATRHWTGRAVCASLLLAALLAIGAPPSRAASPAARADARLDRQLDRVVEMEGGPPGLIAVVHRGRDREVHRVGVANLTNGRKIGARQLMRIASTAKAFSGAVSLSLVDRGVLSLDDTIGELLPYLPAAWSRVTLRQALHHTSGIPDFTQDSAFQKFVGQNLHAEPPPRRMLDFVADEPLEFPPGSRYKYSNSDNFIVGLMVESATRRSYERELSARLYERLHLIRTDLPRGFRMPLPFMHGYGLEPGEPPEDLTTLVSAAFSWASGGIVSTPLELNRFIRAYAGGRLFGERTQRRQLQFVDGKSEPPGPGKNRAGLAIFRYRTSCGVVYGHTGNTLGYTQFMASTKSGRRSATVSATAQITPDAPGRGPLVFPALREAFEDAVCAALAPRRRQ